MMFFNQNIIKNSINQNNNDTVYNYCDISGTIDVSFPLQW